MIPIVKVVQPSGILDTVSGNQLRHDISEIVATGADIVLIDLQDVKFIDSSGLGALVSALKMVRAIEGKLFVCSINEQIRIVFELTGMDQFFKNFADRDDFNRQVIAT